MRARLKRAIYRRKSLHVTVSDLPSVVCHSFLLDGLQLIGEVQRTVSRLGKWLLLGDAPPMNSEEDEGNLRDEIARLESDLSHARIKLKAVSGNDGETSPQNLESGHVHPHTEHKPLNAAAHALLLLSDSALPLGSFAFSSGLESYLAHCPSRHASSIHPFLALSLRSVAGTVLPYLLAAYKSPSTLASLDDTLDACTLCHVARRASIAQGCALITLWERALKATVDPQVPAASALTQFSKGMKTKSGSEPDGEVLCGHFAPIWGVVTAAMGIAIKDSAYTFLLNHAKAVLSAAVRASVIGPYQAQGLLAGDWLRQAIARCMEENWDVPLEDAGQMVPMMDIWIGRHEMLYSRIFNS